MKALFVPRSKPTRFSLGRTVMTRGIAELIDSFEVSNALSRHSSGDWGESCPEDIMANDRAVISGDRILSVYKSLTDIKFWIITEADRSYTTVLLPDEY